MKKRMPMMSQRSRLSSHQAPSAGQIASQARRPSSWSVGRGCIKIGLLTRSVSEGVGKSSLESPSLTLRVSFETASKQTARHAERQRGFTLFEILLSLGLFLGALAVLSQMWYGGVRASVQSRLRTQAIFRCESKLNEVVAGVVPLQSTGDTPFEDDSTWTWNLQVETFPHADLLKAVVNVTHPGQGGLSSSSHQLSRLIRDPQVWVNAQQTTTEEQQQ